MATNRSSKKQTNSSRSRPAKQKKAGAPPAPRTVDVGAGAKKSAKADRPAKERKLSALSGAAQILAEADGPLSAGEIVKRMLEMGLWQTKGKTPQATLYSALLRRIRKDGATARFRKVERGKFALNAWGSPAFLSLDTPALAGVFLGVSVGYTPGSSAACGEPRRLAAAYSLRA
jgi:hypothetical protein